MCHSQGSNKRPRSPDPFETFDTQSPTDEKSASTAESTLSTGSSSSSMSYNLPTRSFPRRSREPTGFVRKTIGYQARKSLYKKARLRELYPQFPFTLSSNLENSINQDTEYFEPMPTAATMMSFPLPQIQHQGMQPEADKLVYPIGYLGQIGDPDNIGEVENLYKDRLAVREQIDWECRRIGLRLMRLRELNALKAQFSIVDPDYSTDTSQDSDSISESSGASEDGESGEKSSQMPVGNDDEDIWGPLWSWSNTDEDLLGKIRDLKLKNKKENGDF